EEYGINLIDSIKSAYDGIILAVAHQEFLELELDQLKSSDSSVLFDTKAFLDRSIIDARL
ncbi:Vi polysaccharide biosynthesis UDP-N-acetylglucosamine C-6 dehydrogenase TviB, partial [Vibrio parahaemolyticus]